MSGMSRLLRIFRRNGGRKSPGPSIDISIPLSEEAILQIWIATLFKFIATGDSKTSLELLSYIFERFSSESLASLKQTDSSLLIPRDWLSSRQPNTSSEILTRPQRLESSSKQRRDP